MASDNKFKCVDEKGDFTIYGGGFPYDITEEELENLITPFGKPKKIMPYKPTGEFRGVVFVKMENREAAEKVIKGLCDQKYKNKLLKLRYVDQNRRDDRPPQRRRSYNDNPRQRDSYDMNSDSPRGPPNSSSRFDYQRRDDDMMPPPRREERRYDEMDDRKQNDSYPYPPRGERRYEERDERQYQEMRDERRYPDPREERDQRRPPYYGGGENYDQPRRYDEQPRQYHQDPRSERKFDEPPRQYYQEQREERRFDEPPRRNVSYPEPRDERKYGDQRMAPPPQPYGGMPPRDERRYNDAQRPPSHQPSSAYPDHIREERRNDSY